MTVCDTTEGISRPGGCSEPVPPRGRQAQRWPCGGGGPLPVVWARCRPRCWSSGGGLCWGSQPRPCGPGNVSVVGEFPLSGDREGGPGQYWLQARDELPVWGPSCYPVSGWWLPGGRTLAGPPGASARSGAGLVANPPVRLRFIHNICGCSPRLWINSF